MQLLGLQLLTLLQVDFHQGLVHLDHLVDDAAVGLGDVREIGGRAAGLKEAVDDLFAAIRRQIDGQAFGAEGVADLSGEVFQVHPLGIDLVDDDEAAQLAILCDRHHALGDPLYPRLGVDDHRRRLHRRQHGYAAAQEVRKARGIEQINMLAIGIKAGDADVKGVPVLLFQGVVVTDRGAPGHATRRGDHPRRGEQGLDQRGLARTGGTNQGNVADVLGIVIRHGANLPSRVRGW